MNSRSSQDVIAPVRHQVLVNAPAERAFSVFTEGFGDWWPKTHTISQGPVERAIELADIPDGERAPRQRFLLTRLDQLT